MAAEDPLTAGEIRRDLDRLERSDRALGDRMTQLAAEMLPVRVWDVQRRALEENLARHEKGADEARTRLERDVEELQGDIKELREERDRRSEITWTKIIGLITALATLAAVVVGVIGLTRGIK